MDLYAWCYILVLSEGYNGGHLVGIYLHYSSLSQPQNKDILLLNEIILANHISNT